MHSEGNRHTNMLIYTGKKILSTPHQVCVLSSRLNPEEGK